MYLESPKKQWGENRKYIEEIIAGFFSNLMKTKSTDVGLQQTPSTRKKKKKTIVKHLIIKLLKTMIKRKS